MAKRKKPVPLVPPPTGMKSRKKARQVTSLFHKLTRKLDEAKSSKDEDAVQSLEKQIHDMGGREEYQRASQLSTKFHSTSKWVLGELGKRKWLHGIECDGSENTIHARKRNRTKRAVRILEVGAINTELIDAAARCKRITSNLCTDDSKKLPESKEIPLYNLDVQAIDLKSSHPQIKEQDFLTLPVEVDSDGSGVFDVIVCSMVLNCVTNAADRGKMLTLLFRQLRPHGLCFLTLPRLCLNQSKYLSKKMFEDMLRGVGFDLESKKESPKVAFWVLRRSSSHLSIDAARRGLSSFKEWKQLNIVNKGKKFRNDFGVILHEDDLSLKIG